MGDRLSREMCENLLRTYERETGAYQLSTGRYLSSAGASTGLWIRWAVSGVSVIKSTGGCSHPLALLWITAMSSEWGKKNELFQQDNSNSRFFFKKEKSYYMLCGGWFSE